VIFAMSSSSWLLSNAARQGIITDAASRAFLRC
jgi:hypothetical protein